VFRKEINKETLKFIATSSVIAVLVLYDFVQIGFTINEHVKYNYFSSEHEV